MRVLLVLYIEWASARVPPTPFIGAARSIVSEWANCGVKRLKRIYTGNGKMLNIVVVFQTTQITAVSKQKCSFHRKMPFGLPRQYSLVSVSVRLGQSKAQDASWQCMFTARVKAAKKQKKKRQTDKKTKQERSKKCKGKMRPADIRSISKLASVQSREGHNK